ncbi:alpha/beta-hydrolase [Lentithecium fluviatile CBS 122367]|uniref:Alpha/beta-hydrolase n=1 Tax=Lentithecium fluviatile CBS 122367 TaxID=1168545 RepID=A0A6G1IUW9_9PLEO|nr:alpha/beta-hydrolase [Lentithecium fluviatile CBS 122367]
MSVQPQSPPVPSVPADAKSNPIHGLRSRRRSSLPSVPTDLRVKKRPPPNYIRTQTASPEVISSLIDSLSAISASAHNHFENLPTSYGEGASLSVPASPFTSSFGGHDGHAPAYYQNLKNQDLLYPDDACEPPVIRTSKPPSGLSPLTAPKKKDKEHSLRSYIGRSGGSSASIQSAHSGRSASSFGNISIEAGIPRKTSDGSNRTSTESKRSARGHRSLMYMGSRERLRLKDAERKRATIQGPEVAASPDIPRKPTPQLPLAEDTIKEEPVMAESSRAAQRFPRRGVSPLRNSVNLLSVQDGGSPTEQGLIPERGSSLRHSGSPSRKGRRSHTRSSSRTNRHDSYKTNTVPEEDESATQEATVKEKILKELEAEEDEVARRIRELRKQKLLRDKIAGKLPVGVDAGASSSVAHVSPIASAEPSPTSSVSSLSEKRVQDPAKAHKVLGITLQTMRPTPPERRGSRVQESKEAGETRETQKKLGHSRTRSLTVNDGDEITPLPINYRLALQTLEQNAPVSPPPPSSSSASTRTGKTQSSDTPPRRTKSVAVGGRSAVGRQTTSSIIMGVNTASKDSAGVTNHAPSERSLRSVSEDTATRHLSLSMAPSNSLQHRPTLKKKRWSHPDLPAKAEKTHNDKVDAINAAAARGPQVRAPSVQKPPYPVIEERPTSADSIDMDVERYLNAPRLSQRIRHPQTGRIISFSEVGDAQGFAVFVCVGMGLTRYVMSFYDQLASTLKLRLITPDRPGIGGSQVDPNGTPLSWPDDVLIICQALKITKFSLLAHSAGAVYALATSLRMPQHIRGRVHLLAPWIPPSQMEPIGISQDQPPTQQLPRSQRFLRALPPSLLKVANSTFLSATSASLQRSGPKNSPKPKRKSVSPQIMPQQQQPVRPQFKESRRESMMKMDQILPNASSLSLALTNPMDPNYEKARSMKEALTAVERQRQHEFDERLTFAIWDRATANANPATDLIVCLETRQTIGFRYEDINRPVVIHHGSKDSRVPVDNVRWLGRLMRKCEVRILDGEQHGLMASAQVMGNVLTEMASDWEDWTAVVQGKANGEKSISRKRTAERLRNITSRHGNSEATATA